MAIFGISFVQFSRFTHLHVVFGVWCVLIGVVLPQMVQRPRGVSLTNKPFYDNKETFTCLDGSLKIPFSLVNDDYCDCKDGTDEPGTSACPNGQFHCVNAGHKPMYVPSSRVNDAICDCCDTSDEYDGKVNCVNNCKELGKEERERRQQEIESFNEGYKIRLEYVKEGKEKMEENRKKLIELQAERRLIENIREDKKVAKETAEMPEKEAKEQHQDAWDKLKDQQKEIKQREEAAVVFQELDTNQDGLVSAEEVQKHLEFDIDKDGKVSHEEALAALVGNSEVSLTVFLDRVWQLMKGRLKAPKKDVLIDDDVSLDLFAKEAWPLMKDKYKPLQQLEEPAAPSDMDVEDIDAGEINTDDYEDYGDEDAYDDEDEDDDDEESYDGVKPKSDKDKDEMPEYNEETKTLIEAADKARQEYSEIDDQYRKLNNDIGDIDKVLGYDLGEENEFYSIHSQCFELQDKEYTYKFCPFGKVTQKPKVGRETTLGNYKHWDGPDGSKYSRMKYGGGEKCWNGPDRSTMVKLSCGLENTITKASEPSRCEYELEFTTPALCNKVIDPNVTDKHDEL